VIQDDTGALWIGTYGGGLDRLDLKTQTFTHYRHTTGEANSLSNDLIEGLLLDRDGTLWISTDGGLDHFDPRSGRFKSYKHDPNDPQSISNDEVLEARRDTEAGCGPSTGAAASTAWTRRPASSVTTSTSQATR